MTASPTLASTRLFMGWKPLAVIDREVTLSRLNRGSPGRGCEERGAAERQQSAQERTWAHFWESPNSTTGKLLFKTLITQILTAIYHIARDGHRFLFKAGPMVVSREGYSQ
jgi:hypothetical protein